MSIPNHHPLTPCCPQKEKKKKKKKSKLNHPQGALRSFLPLNQPLFIWGKKKEKERGGRGGKGEKEEKKKKKR